MNYSWITKIYLVSLIIFFVIIMLGVLFFLSTRTNLLDLSKFTGGILYTEQKNGDDQGSEIVSNKPQTQIPDKSDEGKNHSNQDVGTITKQPAETTPNISYTTIKKPFTIPDTETRFSTLLSWGSGIQGNFTMVLKHEDGRELNPSNSDGLGVVYAEGDSYMLYNTNTYCKTASVTGSWEITITAPNGSNPNIQVASFKDCS